MTRRRHQQVQCTTTRCQMKEKQKVLLQPAAKGALWSEVCYALHETWSEAPCNPVCNSEGASTACTGGCCTLLSCILRLPLHTETQR